MKMPALFVGHGSPMNVLQPKLAWNQNLRRIGQSFPKPEAIVCISAHWYDGLQITGAQHPEIIYDFYGFPEELYQQQYPVSGNPQLAAQLQNLLPEAVVHPSRGLDHGAWAILKYLYPDADVPVVQLGLDLNRPPQWHYELAKKLNVLRGQGILILGSGDIVHNLRTMRRESAAYDWADEFRNHINQMIVESRHQEVVDYWQFGDAARLSVPTNEHFLPLLYVLAQQDEHSRVEIFNDDIVLGSISMTSVLVS